MYAEFSQDARLPSVVSHFAIPPSASRGSSLSSARRSRMDRLARKSSRRCNRSPGVIRAPTASEGGRDGV